jgi:hypothetical protein
MQHCYVHDNDCVVLGAPAQGILAGLTFTVVPAEQAGLSPCIKKLCCSRELSASFKLLKSLQLVLQTR